jgi:hypothetical protein
VETLGLVRPNKKGDLSVAPLVVYVQFKPGQDDDRLVYEHPVVLPHVSHFMQVPLRTSVKLPHSLHISPS